MPDNGYGYDMNLGYEPSAGDTASTDSISVAGLDSARVAEIDVELEKARVADERAQVLAVNADTWFARLIGAESSIEAARSNAHSTHSLYVALKNKRDTIVTGGNPDQVADYIRDLGVVENTKNLEDVARTNSASNAIRQIGTESIKDAANLATTGLTWVLGLGAVVGVVAIFVLVPRARAMVFGTVS